MIFLIGYFVGSVVGAWLQEFSPVLGPRARAASEKREGR